jgi:PAS domain S-box-containing protein
LFPKSLVGRVFALYSVTLLAFVGGSLGLFYQYQFGYEVEAAQSRAEALASVLLPTVSDSAVIGDDDTIARTLERAIYHSSLGSAAFIDLKGRQVVATRSDSPVVKPPEWLVSLVQPRLYDTNRPISVGGRDYGVMRLRFAPELIAGELWRPIRAALALAAISFAGGLLLIRWLLVHWLGHFGRLRSLEETLRTGEAGRPTALDENAPIELRETIAVLNQAAENLHAQREQAAVTLGAIGDAVLTTDAQGRVMLANPAASVLFDCSFEGLLEQSVRGLLPQAFADNQALQGWRGRRFEIQTGDGNLRVLDTTMSPILGPSGEAVCHVLACRDITEQHVLDMRLRSELAARQSEAPRFLRRLLRLRMEP